MRGIRMRRWTVRITEGLPSAAGEGRDDPLKDWRL